MTKIIAIRFKLLQEAIYREKSILRPLFRELIYLIWRLFRFYSLKAAAREQNLVKLMKQLEKIIPDYKNQYSYSTIEGEFWTYKVRAHHAFQVRITNEAIQRILQEKQKKEITIVDIGDSSGTHMQYFKELHKENNIRSISVNLDPVAVEKIKKKGLEAIHAKAEDLEKYQIHPDVFVSFQTVEHLNSPISFLKAIADKSSCKYFVLTVPYRKVSRVGLHHIRCNNKESVPAERTHIFELCPEDWKLICQHSGWKVIKDTMYWQYPLRHFFRFLRKGWEVADYEGFYGIILEKDSTWSERYLDW